MKKLLFLFVAASLFSCGKLELTSLEGSTWLKRDDGKNKTWSEDRLVFSSGEAEYSRIAWYGSTGHSVKGTYTFVPPTVTIYEDIIDPQGKPAVRRHTGTVNGNTMNIDIMTGDILWSLELKLQK